MKLKRSIITFVLASLAICGAGLLATNKGTPVAKAAVGTYTTNASTFYSSITATSGTSLLGQVHDLMTTNHKTYTTYDDCKTPATVYKTDPGSSSSYMTDFYTTKDIKYAWGSGSVGTWNREHVWCQSLSNSMWGEAGGGGDIHHIRPVECTLNSTRSNNPFGNAREEYPSTYKDATSRYDSSVGGYYVANKIFEPLDSVKGDVARIIMYVYAHYSTYGNVGGTTNGSGSSSYFGTLKITSIMYPSTEAACWSLLLDWNKNDPVDSVEQARNEAAATMTGTRNAFIDHPEYADAIWGSTPLSGNTTTSSSSSSSKTSSSSSNKTSSSSSSSSSSTSSSSGISSSTSTSSSSGTTETPTSLIDTITATKTGVTTTSYKEWTYASNANYSGKTSTNSSNIQLNKGNSVGIVVTENNNDIDSVTVTIASGSNSLNIYGSNTPYSAVSDLYDTSKQGTLIKTITSTSTFDVGDYRYIGFLSGGNVIYIKSISITYNDNSTPSSFFEKGATLSSLKFTNNKTTGSTITAYKKVTDSLSDYSGQYLIVNESNSVAANGSLGETLYKDNSVSVSISNDIIGQSATTDGYSFTIAKTDGGYSLKTASGYYIGNTRNSTYTDFSTETVFSNTINVSDGVATITSSGGAIYRYDSSNTVFKYFKTSDYSSKETVSLYKLVTFTETEYTPSNVALRFGSVISYSDWTALLSSSNVTGYGVFAALNSNISSTTIEEIYTTSGEDVNSETWIKNHNIYHATVRGAEDNLTIYRCDSTGLVSDDNGEYLTWKYKFNIKETAYAKKLSAVSYIIVDEEYVFSEQVTESVASLAARYIDSDVVDNDDYLGALRKLASYGA